MMKGQFLYLDAVDTIKRRKYYLLVPAVALLILSTAFAYLLPLQYESSSLILIRQDTPAQPQGPPQPGAAQADRFTVLNDILLSHGTFVALLDSLVVKKAFPGKPPNSEDAVADLEGSVVCENRGGETMRITVRRRDPVQARDIAFVLTNLLLGTSRRLELQRLDDAVAFYERKLSELRHTPEPPSENAAPVKPASPSQNDGPTRAALGRVNRELEQSDSLAAQLEQSLLLLRAAAEKIDEPQTIVRIASLAGRGAYIPELKALSARYAELLNKYTQRYPEVQGIRRQVLALLEKAVKSTQADLERGQKQAEDLRAQRDSLRALFSTPSLPAPVTQRQREIPTVNQKLIDDLRLQLAQAKVARDLQAASGSGLAVLDYPQVPSHASSPDRPLIIVTGTLAGILSGIIALLAVEYLDTTIRRQRDLKGFQKPIIAYLP